MATIEEFQYQLYSEVEHKKIENLIGGLKKKYGSYKAVKDIWNERMKALGWPEFSDAEMTLLRKADKNTKRRNGWNERTLFRLAMALGLATQPVDAFLILSVFLKKEAWEPTTDSTMRLITAIEPREIKAATMGSFIDAIALKHEGALMELFRTSTLQSDDLEPLRSGERDLSEAQKEAVTEWAAQYGVKISPALLSLYASKSAIKQ